MSLDVHHNTAVPRFEAIIEGHLCVAQYRVFGKVLMATHTGVPVMLRGRGIAAELVRALLDHARAKGLKVRPDCSSVETYMRRHPETQDLLND